MSRPQPLVDRLGCRTDGDGRIWFPNLGSEPSGVSPNVDVAVYTSSDERRGSSLGDEFGSQGSIAGWADGQNWWTNPERRPFTRILWFAFVNPEDERAYFRHMAGADADPVQRVASPARQRRPVQLDGDDDLPTEDPFVEPERAEPEEPLRAEPHPEPEQDEREVIRIVLKITKDVDVLTASPHRIRRAVEAIDGIHDVSITLLP